MRVAIIGAGVCGIVALKCCLEEELDAVCYEQNESFGGLWMHRSKPTADDTSVTQQVICNTSKEMMAFSDFPPPVAFPLYMPQNKYKEYLQLYVKHFDLEGHMKFNTKVYLSTRAGKWICKRLTPSGLPLDVQLIRRLRAFIMQILPPKIQQIWLKNIFDLNHEFFGLEQDSAISARTAIVSDDVIDKIACGQLILKPSVERFDSNEIFFVDGTKLTDIDVVICGTGYELDYSFLAKPLLTIKNNKLFAYKHVFPPELINRNLAVIGCMEVFGSMAPLYETQCRLATRVFKGLVKLPSKEVILEDITNTIDNQRNVDMISYQDELCELIGCKPNILRLLLSEDLFVGLSVLLGPLTPYQFRLTGPGKWTEAKSAILDQWKRMCYPTNKHLKSKLTPWTADFLKVVIPLMIIGFVFIVLLTKLF